MWQTKTFKTREAMESFTDRNDERIQWEEIFINQANKNEPRYGIIYRPLRIIDIR